jgi:hypothetical protein
VVEESLGMSALIPIRLGKWKQLQIVNC